MNRNNLIMGIAFLVTVGSLDAMQNECGNEKIVLASVLGKKPMPLSIHLVQAIVYDDAPLNKVRIYRYKHEKLVKKSKFGKFTEEKKWEISDTVYSKNYVYVAGAHPKLVLGIKDKAQVEELFRTCKKQIP